MSSKSELAQVLLNLTYSDLMDVSKLLVNHDLDETYEISEALINVAKIIHNQTKNNIGLSITARMANNEFTL